MTDNNNGIVRTNAETQALEALKNTELWTPGDVCSCFDWTRHRLKLARDGENFPAAFMHVQGGKLPLYLADDVRRWYVETQPHMRTQAWRHDQALAMYRRGVTIAKISRALKMKGETIRRYLRDAGETLPSERKAETQASERYEITHDVFGWVESGLPDTQLHRGES